MVCLLDGASGRDTAFCSPQRVHEFRRRRAEPEDRLKSWISREANKS
ncbi:hypothetical protein KCP78_05480 [Salmonella enterica subsp. enterica]|nr:hypothetical protein KCP78_05480 [Salmonella enterica subsp. enterica]